jgi:hypothetical protein
MTVAVLPLDAYPSDLSIDKTLLTRCIDACSDCAPACTACADSCLAERGDVESLVKC